MYTYIHIQLFTGEGNTHPPCKVYHLDISGETHIEYYDQQVIKSCFVNHDKDEMTLLVEEMKTERNGILDEKPSSKNVKVYCWGLNDKGQLAGVKGSKVSFCLNSSKIVELYWFMVQQ